MEILRKEGKNEILRFSNLEIWVDEKKWDGGRGVREIYYEKRLVLRDKGSLLKQVT